MQSVKGKKEITKEFIVQRDELVDMIDSTQDDIHNLLYRLSGASCWFKAFIQSDAFNELKPEWKAEAFDNYTSLSTLLDLMDLLNCISKK